MHLEQITWFGHSPNDRTWKLAENFNNTMEIVADFHRRYPKKLNNRSCITTDGTHVKGGLTILEN